MEQHLQKWMSLKANYGRASGERFQTKDNT